MPVTERGVVARALWSLHGLGWRLDAVGDVFRGVRLDGGHEFRRVFLMRRPGFVPMFGPNRADVLPFEAPLKGRR